MKPFYCSICSNQISIWNMTAVIGKCMKCVTLSPNLTRLTYERYESAKQKIFRAYMQTKNETSPGLHKPGEFEQILEAQFTELLRRYGHKEY